MPNTAVAVADKPSTIFRSNAASLMKSAADMTLHELVDEFLSLSETIEKAAVPNDDWRKRLTDEGQVALRDRKMINAALRARFGLSLESYDRDGEEDGIPA